MKLLLRDGKQLVMTNSWSLAGRGNAALAEVCYTWGADGVSFFSGSTGTRRVALSINVGAFRRMMETHRSCLYIDLTDFCR